MGPPGSLRERDVTMEAGRSHGGRGGDRANPWATLPVSGSCFQAWLSWRWHCGQRLCLCSAFLRFLRFLILGNEKAGTGKAATGPWRPLLPGLGTAAQVGAQPSQRLGEVASQGEVAGEVAGDGVPSTFGTGFPWTRGEYFQLPLSSPSSGRSLELHSQSPALGGRLPS